MDKYFSSQWYFFYWYFSCPGLPRGRSECLLSSPLLTIPYPAARTSGTAVMDPSRSSRCHLQLANVDETWGVETTGGGTTLVMLVTSIWISSRRMFCWREIERTSYIDWISTGSDAISCPSSRVRDLFPPNCSTLDRHRSAAQLPVISGHDPDCRDAAVPRHSAGRGYCILSLLLFNGLLIIFISRARRSNHGRQSTILELETKVTEDYTKFHNHREGPY